MLPIFFFFLESLLDNTCKEVILWVNLQAWINYSTKNITPPEVFSYKLREIFQKSQSIEYLWNTFRTQQASTNL